MTDDRQASKVIALEQFGEALAEALRNHEAGRRQLTSRGVEWGVAAAVSAILIACVAFTAPGRALAERIGELVGIGDEPSGSATNPIDSPDVVIGVGEAPGGLEYEVVASTDIQLQEDDGGATCIYVAFPESKPSEGSGWIGGGTGGFNCKQNSPGNGIGAITVLGPPQLMDYRLMVRGIVSTDVETAAILGPDTAGEGASSPVSVFRLTDELRKSIGATDELHFLLAFMPQEILPLAPADFSPEDGIAGLKDPESDPTRQTLLQYELVTYGADGGEINRLALGKNPFVTTILQQRSSPTSQALSQAFAVCIQELVDARGDGAKLTPDLTKDQISELYRCAEQRVP